MSDDSEWSDDDLDDGVTQENVQDEPDQGDNQQQSDTNNNNTLNMVFFLLCV